MARGARIATWLFTVCVCGEAGAGALLMPVLNRPVSDKFLVSGAAFTMDLGSTFGMEEVDNQVVRFTTEFSNGALPVVLDMALFSKRTPATRANFLKYVADGDYVNSFIHRSVPGFVIQGGGFGVANNSIGSVPVDPPVVNEFGVSNTLGTISMAKSGGDPNSATSQWFVSLGANSDNLDNQNGGFTVFGRVTKNTMQFASAFGNPSIFPAYDYQGYFGPAFGELPLFYTHQYGNPRIEELILFTSVGIVPMPGGQAGQDPALSFTVTGNTNPSLLATMVTGDGRLVLTPAAGQTGTAKISLRAVDSVGNTVDDSFDVSVGAADTYGGWSSRQSFSSGGAAAAQDADGDGVLNLLEYAFLGDPSRPRSALLPMVAADPSMLAVTFPVRKSVSDLTYVVESADRVEGPWTTTWSSTSGFAHPNVVKVDDFADRSMVTVKDTVSKGSVVRRFLRVRVSQP
jgi:cyclophilin family peptidyl-prolyl cis-trans isomerase